MTTFPKFSIYMPMVNGYHITKLTLDSLIDNIGFSFNKFIIIASGTTDGMCHSILRHIREEGYRGVPKEKFKVIILPSEQAIDFARSMNVAIRMLDPDEDMFFVENNTLFGRNFMTPIIENAYFKKYSNDVFMLCHFSALQNNFKLHEAYDLEVRPFFKLGVSPEQGLLLIHDFFKRHSEMNKDFNELSIQMSYLFQNQGDSSSFSEGAYIKRSCFNQVGFLDEQFPSGGNETDYTIRINNLNKIILCVKSSVYLHIAYGITSRRDDKQEVLMVEGGERLAQKYDLRQKKVVKTQHGFEITQQPVMKDQDYVMVGQEKLSLHHNVLQHLGAVPWHPLYNTTLPMRQLLEKAGFTVKENSPIAKAFPLMTPEKSLS